MLLEISHSTTYNYSEPVFLEPHYLYLYPAHRSHIEKRSFAIDISPRPEGLSIKQDPENNIYKQCWFSGMHDHLGIELNLKVKVNELNPFDFLIEDWPEKLHPALLPYLEKKKEMGPEVMAWARGLGLDARKDALKFLDALNREINTHWDHEIRYESSLLDPEECFSTRSGSCRDLSWLMMQILRHLDIPSRFVSGYAHNPELLEGHELHAWPEAWLPGAGWIGFDPSAGLFVDHMYIPLTCSHHPANTLPVQGSYRGNASSELTTRVNILEKSDPA